MSGIGLFRGSNGCVSTLLTDTDRVARRVRQNINGTESTLHTARMAHGQTLHKAVQVLRGTTRRSTQFAGNKAFRREVSDTVYALTSRLGHGSRSHGAGCRTGMKTA